jgi:GNAT superfamily N-acetyltransferase
MARHGHARGARLPEPRLPDRRRPLTQIEASGRAAFEVRRLGAADLDALDRRLPLWNAREYARRLLAQTREQMVQAVAWFADVPGGRGSVLFPEHEEFSTSAIREGCAEARDVFVVRPRRRLGVASAIMATLEEASREHGLLRIGLSVALDEEAAPARSLYERLGYRHAHGPFVSSTNLLGDEGPIAVGAVMTYLVKDL